MVERKGSIREKMKKGRVRNEEREGMKRKKNWCKKVRQGRSEGRRELKKEVVKNKERVE